jgi:transcriptional regulator with XRE-family HTH domain
VGERVRRVREDRDLTLQDISQRTGLDVAFLEQIENGNVAPPLGTVIKLAKALDLKMGYFISGEEDMPLPLCGKSDRKVVSRYSSKRASITDMVTSPWPPIKRTGTWSPFSFPLNRLSPMKSGPPTTGRNLSMFWKAPWKSGSVRSLRAGAGGFHLL